MVDRPMGMQTHTQTHTNTVKYSNSRRRKAQEERIHAAIGLTGLAANTGEATSALAGEGVDIVRTHVTEHARIARTLVDILE